MYKFDYLIVGCGLTGATCARLLAEKNKTVCIIDRRHHAGGICYDYYNTDGILVHAYGPHIFHTNNRQVWDFVNRFSNFIPYFHIAKVYTDGKFVDFPPNLNTIKDLNIEVINTNIDYTNAETYLYTTIGKDLTDKIYKGYSEKQWGCSLSDIDYHVVERVKFNNIYDSRYFTDIYQGIPEYGYTYMFNKILEHPNITLLLGLDYNNHYIKSSNIIYTGCIDEYFDKNSLEYINIEFKFKTFDVNFYQGYPQINYPNNFDYTRSVEYKRITNQEHSKTTIGYEYPSINGESCYPKFTKENIKKYQKFNIKANKYKNLYLCGRMAEFKYFNMDSAIYNAMSLCNKLL